LRSLLENDTSSTSAAAIGAAAGTATSAAIGGVGVAVGGSAIGVGMASMAAGGAIVGLGLVGLNRLLQQGIDPEKLLDSAIEQMEEDSRKARQAIANVVASQRRIQQQYEQAQLEVDKWQQRAQLALQKGDEYLAGEALSRKKMHSGILSSLKAQLDQEPTSINNFKQKLTLLETKISEAKSMQTRLKAQTAIARVNGQLQGSLGQSGVSSAMAFFERMEERVRQIDVRSQAAAELAKVDLEGQFAMLEPSSDIDEELAVMKAQLLEESQQFQSQLPSSEPSNTSSIDVGVDELEELKSQLDRL
jgi:phage shock protein A